jgi:hypothetical protein
MLRKIRGRFIGVIVRIAIRGRDILLPAPTWASPETLSKAESFKDRFREVISDPINILIRRTADAGYVDANGLVILHNGNRVPYTGDMAYYGRFSDLLILNRGVHEPLEEFCFQEVLKRISNATPTMVELGSYWAHYSMWFLKEKPQARSICVEPDLFSLEIGKNNFRINGFVGTHINLGIGAKAASLEDIVSSQGLDKVDILHSDIQGAELEMLFGASHLLESKRIDYIFISTHSESLHNEVIGKLVSFDYRIEVSSPFDEHTTSCDGLVLASSPNATRIFSEFSPMGRLEILKSSPSEVVTYLATQQ